MAIQVLPFNPPQVVTLPRKPSNPYMLQGGQLVSAVVQAMVQNKLDKMRDKQRVDQEMRAKGYRWNDATQTWDAPPINQTDIGDSGDKLITQGGLLSQIYQSPTSRSQQRIKEDEARIAAEDRAQRGRMELSTASDLEKLRESARLTADENRLQEKARADERMASLGGVWNPKAGKWDFPVTVEKDPTSGAYIMQRGPDVNVIDSGKANSDWWLDKSDPNNIKPKEWTSEGGEKGYFQSGGSATTYKGKEDKNTELTVDKAIANLAFTIEDWGIDKESKDYADAHIALLKEIADTKSPMKALHNVLNTVYAKKFGSAGGAQPYTKGGKYKDGRTISQIGTEKTTGRPVLQFTDGTMTYAD